MILAGISLSFVLGDNGILKKAQESADAYKNASQSEQQTLQNIEDYLYGEKGGNNTGDNITDGDNNSTSNNTTGSGGATWTSFTTVQSGVGYYGDLDGDGKPEGIIYADLAFGGNGTWGTTDGTYIYGREDGDMFRPYWVSQNVYDGPFGKKEMVTPKHPDGGITTGEFRFYMMALTDIDGKRNGTYYDWYHAAYDKGISDGSTITSGDFGTGKTNTATMIDKWNAKAYGAQDTCSDHKDMWGQIQEKERDWFVPSRAEWAAFAGELGITSSNYDDFGLSDYYWSSSLYITNNSAWIATFRGGCMGTNYFNSLNYVRLGAFF